jgi:general secretion pathway protein D
MPRQVLNEVLIAEVRLTDELKYGVEFLLGLSPTAPTTTTGADGTSTTTTTTAPGAIPGLQVLTGAAAAFSGLGGLTFVISDAANKFRGLINLLASQGRADILASPHIMAANNQEARIQIGEDVPIKTSESVPLISQTTSFQTSTVQYRSTGIILSVKPQINAKGQVTMEITQEVSSAQDLRLGETSPRISVRQAKTTLTTADNQTVVLGGLIREDRIKTQAGIPGLRKIPLLGSLFGSEGVKKEKTELLVLITPRIVANLEDGARITHEMKDRMGLDETPQRGPGAPRPVAPPQ